MTEGLIQSRSIDHLLCGDDGNISKNILLYSFDNFHVKSFLRILILTFSLLFTLGTCETQLSGAENCFSVLVETGVYSRSSKEMVSLGNYFEILPFNLN